MEIKITGTAKQVKLALACIVAIMGKGAKLTDLAKVMQEG